MLPGPGLPPGPGGSPVGFDMDTPPVEPLLVAPGAEPPPDEAASPIFDGLTTGRFVDAFGLAPGLGVVNRLASFASSTTNALAAARLSWIRWATYS